MARPPARLAGRPPAGSWMAIAANFSGPMGGQWGQLGALAANILGPWGQRAWQRSFQGLALGLVVDLGSKLFGAMGQWGALVANFVGAHGASEGP